MHKQLSVIYRKAIQNKPELDNILNSVAELTGAMPISNLKNPTSTMSKVEHKEEGYKLSDVNDVVRGRLVYNSKGKMQAGLDEFKEALEEKKIKIVKEENFFDKPENGYEGYHVDMKFPNGQVGEVQFHTIQSYAAALATHEMYKQSSDKEPKDIKEQEKFINTMIMQMSDKDALKVAQSIERDNAGVQANAQQKAIKAAIQPSQITTPYPNAQTYV